jgi:uncharacterized protein YdhG (YjbR/CyaY superfamily)
MTMRQKNVKSVSEYIDSYPKDAAAMMKQIRATLHKAEPKLEEAIKYGFPCFMYNGHNATYFAAIKGHVSVYAIYNPKFKKEMAPYLAAKGTLRFPLGEKLPAGLITKALKQRIAGLKEKDKEKSEKDEKRK